MNRNIALKIAYQGQDFAGWQRQPKERTVEGELHKALGLLKMHSANCGAKIKLYGAGRTDKGVHASGQVANFYTQNHSVPAHRFREALNARLPKDVRILQSCEVEPDFHARYSARARAYEYRIIQSASLAPEQKQNAWYLCAPRLDLAILNCMAGPLIGEHDFSAFTVSGDQAKRKVRTIYAASFYCDGPYVVFRIVGNAFLWHMVRSIVGTLIGLYNRQCKHFQNCSTACTDHSGTEETTLLEELYCGRYGLRGQIAQYLLQTEHSGFKAPSHGLNLAEVYYQFCPFLKRP